RRARRSQKPYLDMLSDHPAQHTQSNSVDRHSAGLHRPVQYNPGSERGCPVGVNFDDVALTEARRTCVSRADPTNAALAGRAFPVSVSLRDCLRHESLHLDLSTEPCGFSRVQGAVLGDDDSIYFARDVGRDVAEPKVVCYALGLAFERVAVAAAASRTQ